MFNFEECKKALAEMNILDELSFRFVEGFGFRKFMFVTNLGSIQSLVTQQLPKLALGCF